MAGTAAKPNIVLHRAFAASSAVVIGAAGMTGVFIARIAKSATAAHSTTSTPPPTSQTPPPRPTSNDGEGDDGNVIVQQPQPQPGAQQNAPVGGSHGS